MKKIFLIAPLFFFFISCQKSVSVDVSNGTADSTITDSNIVAEDLITYEVITDDASGWFGVWNDSTGNLTSNKLDSISYGNPNYFSSGWKYSFYCPNKPFQALISVDAFSFSKNITVNLYKNNKLIKTSSNDPIIGFARLMVNTKTDSLSYTADTPVLKYEVLVSDIDTSAFQSNAWLGQWNWPDGKINSYDDPLLESGSIAMPSGWTYTFKPKSLPFTMKLGAWPYTTNGSLVTINFYVNNQLIKTSSSREAVYPENFTYTIE